MARDVIGSETRDGANQRVGVERQPEPREAMTARLETQAAGNWRVRTLGHLFMGAFYEITREFRFLPFDNGWFWHRYAALDNFAGELNLLLVCLVSLEQSYQDSLSKNR
jgi:hypothetical protein